MVGVASSLRLTEAAANQRTKPEPGPMEDQFVKMQGAFSDLLLLLLEKREGMTPGEVSKAIELTTCGQLAVMAVAMKILMAVATCTPSPVRTQAGTQLVTWAQVASQVNTTSPGAIKQLPQQDEHTVIVAQTSCPALAGDEATTPALTKQVNEVIWVATSVQWDMVVAAQYLQNGLVVLTTATPADKGIMEQHLGKWVSAFGQGAAAH